jgi:glucose/arabinose dehydrogenase
MRPDRLRVLRRTLVGCFCIVAAAVAFIAFANIGGWRARVAARLLRVDLDPIIVPRPDGFVPRVPPGFHVSIFASGFRTPRWLAVAPDGDLFVADSGTEEIVVLRPQGGMGPAQSRRVFADHLQMPFGIAFHRDYVYVANTNEVVRFRYDRATSDRRGGAEHVLDLPGFGYNQHWTRSLAFSRDGQLFVSIGSKTNVSIESDPRRGAILTADPDGQRARVYASGIRNAVGIGVNPQTGVLWATVNERDDLGDDVPPDYFTHVVEGGFYGWPYSFIGQHVDNRVRARPDMVKKAIVPDMVLDAHVAPLQFAFYDGTLFPAMYRHGAFITEHGSWNSRLRKGYQVVFVPFDHGSVSGNPSQFFSGFVPDASRKEVFGRMVGVAVGLDGSLFISDDGGKVIWRVWYSGAS